MHAVEKVFWLRNRENVSTIVRALSLSLLVKEREREKKSDTFPPLTSWRRKRAMKVPIQVFETAKRAKIRVEKPSGRVIVWRNAAGKGGREGGRGITRGLEPAPKFTLYRRMLLHHFSSTLSPRFDSRYDRKKEPEAKLPPPPTPPPLRPPPS